jgi:hypothetical protein
MGTEYANGTNTTTETPDTTLGSAPRDAQDVVQRLTPGQDWQPADGSKVTIRATGEVGEVKSTFPHSRGWVANVSIRGCTSPIACIALDPA